MLTSSLCSGMETRWHNAAAAASVRWTSMNWTESWVCSEDLWAEGAVHDVSVGVFVTVMYWE